MKAVDELATRRFEVDDMFAPIASGSYRTEGMAIIPCSMKTLAGISAGYADNLLLRAAMVSLKEHRRLVLVPREAPLSQIDLDRRCDEYYVTTVLYSAI
jgi:4-hydroxy-3-polyprenylbenzoate decarboxylase